MAVSYEYYRDTYHGTAIAEADWPALSGRAEDQLTRYERIYTVEEPQEGARDRAVCAMAEVYQSFDLLLNGEGGPISGASIGSVSVNYGGIASGGMDISEKGQARTLYRTACLHLDIYRGVS